MQKLFQRTISKWKISSKLVRWHTHILLYSYCYRQTQYILNFFPNIILHSEPFILFFSNHNVLHHGYSLPCIPGEYANNETSILCKKCAENTFSTEKARTTTCDACASGRFSGNGSTTCSTCAPGRFIDGGNCETCIAGKYTPVPDLSECIKCELGRFQDQSSQASCLPCIPGELSLVSGSTKCDLCPENYYSAEKERKTPCIKCAQGRKSANGSTSCSACSPGTFWC